VRALRVIWASPYSLAGALLGLAFRSRRFAHGVLLCEGAEWPRRLGWRYRAITFGHVVLGIDELDEGTMAHELAHVRQYERWGPFLVPAYLFAALWAVLRRRHPYRDNHFEVAARAEVSGGGSLIR
jgi:hypothetical protein